MDGVLHSIAARATYLFSHGRHLLFRNRIAHLFSCGRCLLLRNRKSCISVFMWKMSSTPYQKELHICFHVEDVFHPITERAAYLFSCGRCLPPRNRKLHICFHVEDVFRSITERAAYLFSCGRCLPPHNRKSCISVFMWKMSSTQ